MQPSSRGLMLGLATTIVIALFLAALLAGALVGRPTVAASAQPMDIHLTSAEGSTPAPATISVTGTGTVEGTPDTLTLDLGINAGGSTAESALAQSNTEMRALTGAFKSIPRQDLQTSGLSLNADYNNYGVLTGYSASENLTVIIHDLSTAGRLIDAAASAAGNFATINDISFSISNTSSLIAQARAEAMQSARTEAAQLAAGAGVKLGALQSVSGPPETSTPYGGGDFEINAGLAAAAKSVPLQAGSQPVTIQETVVYTVVQ